MEARRGPRAESSGPGARLEPGTAAYFRRARDTLQKGLSEEELALFAPNVLAEAVAAGPAVALDPGGTQVLQALLPRAPLALLAQALPPLVAGGLGGLAGYPLGARVLEAALARVLPALAEAAGPQEEAAGRTEEAVGRLAAAVSHDLVAFARHPAGSFVLRALLRVLGGGPGAGTSELPLAGAGPKAKGVGPKAKGAGLKAKGVGQKAKGAGPPPTFRPLLEQLADAFQEHLLSLLAPPSASLCLQGALQALHRSQSPACSRLCDALIGQLAPPSPNPAESGLVRALQDPERSRLLEAAMAVAGPGRLRELFQQQLRGHLRGVATHRVANHGLQRLLDHAPADVVGEVLCELGPALAEPLAQGHPGVLTALAGACRRHPALQQEAQRFLFEAFCCWEPAERRLACVRLLGTLRPFRGGDKDKEAEPEPWLGPVTLQGSLLLQHLLHFKDPGSIVGGLEVLPPSALAALARSPPGSRLWDALLTSPTVFPRARRRVLGKLKGHFLSLACHRNGSRVIDAAWASACAATRVAIAEELASHREVLQRDPHGRGVSRSLALDLFLRRRHLWERLQAAPGHRRSVLTAVLED